MWLCSAPTASHWLKGLCKGVEIPTEHKEDSKQVQNWRIPRKNDKFPFFVVPPYQAPTFFWRLGERESCPVVCRNKIPQLKFLYGCSEKQQRQGEMNHAENYSFPKSKQVMLSIVNSGLSLLWVSGHSRGKSVLAQE